MVRGMDGPCVYILASRRHGTLYVGTTQNLARRMAEHRDGRMDSFVRRYRVTRLIHVELFDTVADARARERRLKRWLRVWKVRLIERGNQDWRDIAEFLV